MIWIFLFDVFIFILFSYSFIQQAKVMVASDNSRTILVDINLFQQLIMSPENPF